MVEIALQYRTERAWVEVVLNDFDSFLLDHALCEKKASSTALMFVSRYPERASLAERMARLAREELAHFEQVLRLAHRRGLWLPKEEKNFYVNSLLKELHQPELLNRLLVFALVEARGLERFKLVSEHHADPEIRGFYNNLVEAEQRHRDTFLEFALEYFSSEVVDQHLRRLIQVESEIIQSLPLRPAVH